MHAAALLLCAVVAGADPSITFTNAHEVFELQNRLFQLEQTPHFVVSADGTSLRSPLCDYNYRENGVTWTIEGTYDLKIVPCPGTPGCFLAGFVHAESERNSTAVVDGPGVRRRSPGNMRAYHFAIYVDAANNILLNLERRDLTGSLTADEVETVKANLIKIAQPYVDHLSDNPQDSSIAAQYALLKNEFIIPPPIKIECDIKPLPNKTGYLEMNFRLTAGGRKMAFDRHYWIADFFESDLAIPAERYFAVEQKGAE